MNNNGKNDTPTFLSGPHLNGFLVANDAVRLILPATLREARASVADAMGDVALDPKPSHVQNVDKFLARAGAKIGDLLHVIDAGMATATPSVGNAPTPKTPTTRRRGPP